MTSVWLAPCTTAHQHHLPPFPRKPQRNSHKEQHRYQRIHSVWFHLYNIHEKAKLSCSDRNQKAVAWLRGKGRWFGSRARSRREPSVLMQMCRIFFEKWLYENVRYSKHIELILKSVCFILRKLYINLDNKPLLTIVHMHIDMMGNVRFDINLLVNTKKKIGMPKCDSHLQFLAAIWLVKIDNLPGSPSHLL